MKAQATKVAELLGGELLELLYVGTEDVLKCYNPNVREYKHVQEESLEPTEPSSDRIFQNLHELLTKYKGSESTHYKDVAERLFSCQLSKGRFDQRLRNYVNGTECQLNFGDTADSTGSIVIDRSLKGSVDILLVPLLRLFLRTGRFFSTSCCSGRIVLFESNPDHSTMATKRSKTFGRAGRFLYSSHCHVDGTQKDALASAISAHIRSKHDCYQRGVSTELEHEDGDRELHSSKGNETKECMVWMKFEPFIVHVECASLPDAAELLNITRACGLKKSGIISCSKRIIVSICGSATLETPVAIRQYHTEKHMQGKGPENSDRLTHVNWLISKEYLAHLLDACNRKLSSSISQMLRLYWTCIDKFAIDIYTPFSLSEVNATSFMDRNYDGRTRITTRNADSPTTVEAKTEQAERSAEGACSLRNTEGLPHNVKGLELTRKLGIRGQHPTKVADKTKLYIAVNYRQYIKQLKGLLEKHKLYDRNRKILTPSIYEVYELQELSDVSHYVVTYARSVVLESTRDSNNEEESAEQKAVLSAKSRQGFQPAAFLPVVNATENIVSRLTEEAPYLKERILFFRGRALFYVSEQVIADIVNDRYSTEGGNTYSLNSGRYPN